MEEDRPVAAVSRWVPAAVAALVFCAALAIAFAGYGKADFTVSVPIPAAKLVERGDGERHVDRLLLNDYRMGVWAFGRNAWTLLHHPTRIFQAEPCHPVDRALALHHPVITQGLLAVPGWLLTGDPVATTNLLILLSVLVGAAAVALLVSDWTGVPAAGIAAAMLYAFHADAIGTPFHLGTRDYTWTVLALFFARRLFEGRRARDAAGLAACGLLQIGTSFYPLLASALIALPVFVWLVWHRGVREVPVVPLAGAAVVVAAGGALLLAPYLSLAEAGVLQRDVRFFASWSELAPGGDRFPGWSCLLLVVAALALGRRRAFRAALGDPRAALAIAAVLLALVSTGGNMQAQLATLKGAEPPPIALPNLFQALRALLPGLDGIRMASMLASGTRMLLCLLAGFGAAALLRLAPDRWRTAASAGLVLVVSLDVLRPAFLGMAPPVSFVPLEIRPDAEAVAFFRELEAQGNAGPILEVPIERRGLGYGMEQAPVQHLLSAWHHRRTSGCSPSFTPPEVFALATLSRELPRPGGIEGARALGFTTILVHHPPGHASAARYARLIAHRSRSSGGELERIAESDVRTAYAIRDPRP